MGGYLCTGKRCGYSGKDADGGTAGSRIDDGHLSERIRIVCLTGYPDKNLPEE